MLAETRLQQAHPHPQDSWRVKESHLTYPPRQMPRGCPGERSATLKMCHQHATAGKGTREALGMDPGQQPGKPPPGCPREQAREGKARELLSARTQHQLERVWVRFRVTARPGQAEANTELMAVAIGEPGPYSLLFTIPCAFPFNEN